MVKPAIPLKSTLFFEDYLIWSLSEKEEFYDAKENAKHFLKDITGLYQDTRIQLYREQKEKQLEDSLIKPVLEILGFQKPSMDGEGPVYAVGPSLPSLNGTTTYEPDYALFASRKSYDLAFQNKGDFFRYSVGIGDAKSWRTDLDRKRSGKSPAQQVLEYILLSDRRYGFVTNGKYWRLFRAASADAIFRPDVYLEVDVYRIVAASSAELKSWHRFRQGEEPLPANEKPFSEEEERIFWLAYFFLLFGEDAYTRDGPEDYLGKEQLEHRYSESMEDRTHIQDDLKERVFESLQAVVTGFFNCPEWKEVGSNPPSEEDLQNLYESGLVFLYRILFVLNAEARGLLDSIPYRSMSLTRFAQEIREEMRGHVQMKLDDKLEYVHWKRIRTAFEVVSDKDAAKRLQVTHYDGGLFDPSLEGHELLAKLRLDNQAIFRLVDRMMFVEVELGGETKKRLIDYGALQIRHLGYIYEGLLEYKLRYADRELYLVDGKYVEEAPSSRAIEDTIYENQLYLATDKHEKKITGTYYTPDHVVDHIIKTSLEPLCEEAETPSRIMQLNILDPAMGSGHFLVAAVEYLAGRIHALPDAVIPPEAITTQEADDLLQWKRLVAENCIYGVDKNPLAVELAKLSIWLLTVHKGKALSFLDAQLRCGDSLLGASLDDLDAPALEYRSGKWKRTRSRGNKKFTDTIRQRVEAIAKEAQKLDAVSTTTAEQVSAVRKEYTKKVRKPLASIRVLADLWMKQWFVEEKTKKSIAKQYHDWIDLATKVGFPADYAESVPRPFFHWELEFPNILASGKNRGFDTIIGNPPYEVLASREMGFDVRPMVRFFKRSGIYASSLARRLNFFPLFIERCLQMLAPDGTFSMIVPLAFLGSNQSGDLRGWLLSCRTEKSGNHLLTPASLTEIHAFPQHVDRQNRVFRDAEQATCVFLVRAHPHCSEKLDVITHPGRHFYLEALDGRDTLEESSYYAKLKDIIALDKDSYVIPYGINQEEFDLAVTLTKHPGFQKLGAVAKVGQGEFNLTVSKKKGVTSPESSEDRPILLRGAHIARYGLQEAKQGTDLYVKLDRIKGYLSSEKEEDTKNERIILQEVTRADRDYRRIVPALVEPPSYCGHSANYITDTNPYNIHAILAIIGSSLVEWRFRMTSTSNHVSGREIENIPLPVFRFTPLDAKQRIGGERIVEFHHLLEEQKYQKFSECVENEIRISNQNKWNTGIHDALAALGQWLTNLAKESSQTKERFLGWLEDYLQTSVTEWVATGGFRLIVEAPFKKFYSTIDRNASLLGLADWNTKERHEVLKREYQATVSHMAELKQESDRTEDLVDKILFDMLQLSPQLRRRIEHKAGSRYPSA